MSYSNWTKEERKILSKLTLAAYAYHLIVGLEQGTYTIAEAKRYWESAKDDPGWASSTPGLPGNQTIEKAWELVADAESHFATLEHKLAPEYEAAALAASDNESQTATPEEREAFIHHRRAWENASIYAADAGLDTERLQEAISYYLGYDRQADLDGQRLDRRIARETARQKRQGSHE